MGQKSQYDALHDFSRKNHYSLAHILLKNCPFSKKHVAVIPIFSQKTVHSLKTRYSHVLFSIFSWKTPCCHAHDWSKKHQFCQNCNLLWPLWATKKIGCPFFSISHEKINALMPIFFFKKRPFSINKQLSCPYFVKKDVHSLKNTALSCHFFKFFHKNPHSHAHNLSKNVNSVKTTLSYGS